MSNVHLITAVQPSDELTCWHIVINHIVHLKKIIRIKETSTYEGTDALRNRPDTKHPDFPSDIMLINGWIGAYILKNLFI